MKRLRLSEPILTQGQSNLKNQSKRNKDFIALKAASNPAPVFVLVRPQMAENIGMAARAMMNCGIYDLRVVNPKQSPVDEKALAACSGADVILKNAKVYDSIDNAIADFDFVFATTARTRAMLKPVVLADKLQQFFMQKQNVSFEKTAVLFGCERTGLENTELAVSDALLTVPLNPEHSSLNLSQAVLLIAYEFQKLIRNASFCGAKQADTHYASKQQVQLFLNFLDTLLEQKKYFCCADKHSRMQTNLNNIFLKAELSEQDINTLYGVFKHLTQA